MEVGHMAIAMYVSANLKTRLANPRTKFSSRYPSAFRRRLDVDDLHASDEALPIVCLSMAKDSQRLQV
jgi:hypothetical protein